MIRDKDPVSASLVECLIIFNMVLGRLQVKDWGRVKDCLYLEARIYQALQLHQERNLAAQQFNKLDSLHPSLVTSHQLLLI